MRRDHWFRPWALRRGWLVGGLLLGLLVALSSPGFAYTFSDIEQHWARDSIRRLAESGLLETYPDGLFRPDRPITRAEFAQMATAVFALQEGLPRVFTDAQGHWAQRELSILVDHGVFQLGADATIRPEATLSRAEVGQAVITLLGLQAVSQQLARLDTPRFEDVPAQHESFGALQLAARLNLFPPFLRGRLFPHEPITRGETAYLLDQALRLERASGRLERVDTQRNVLWMSVPNGTERSFPVGDLEVLLQEGWTPWHDLEPGTQVTLISNRFGRPLVAWAEPRTAYQGLLQSLQKLAVALLTPDQLQALLNGDWQQAAETLKIALYQELVHHGVRPWEAEALLAQDWNSVQELGRRRLAEAAASYLSISPQLAFSLLDQDWSTARDYAQKEALERLLEQYLFTSSTPPAGGFPAPGT